MGTTKLLTLTEAAKRLGISHNRLAALAGSDPRFPGRSTGTKRKTWKIHPRALDEWAAEAFGAPDPSTTPAG